MLAGPVNSSNYAITTKNEELSSEIYELIYTNIFCNSSQDQLARLISHLANFYN